MADKPVVPAVPPAPKITPKKPKRAVMRPVVSTDNSTLGVINNAVARQILNPSPDGEDAIDQLPLDVLEATVNGLNRGTGLGEFEPHAKRLAAQTQDKAELVAAIVQGHEMNRLVANMKSRAKVENQLHRTVDTGEMSTLEALTFYDQLNRAVSEGLTLLKKPIATLDSITIIEKVDIHRQEAEKTTQQKFINTTPQGREIIRRSAHAILKAKADAAAAAGNTVIVEEVSGT